MRTTTDTPRIATLLTLLVLVLVPVATGVGLLVPGFYRDAAWMVPQARGQDFVTLVVAEPLLLGAMFAARRGHLGGRLVWMGVLGYMLYTYAMYSYTAYFNALFLVYVALFSASLFALVDLLIRVYQTWIRVATPPSAPIRRVRGIALFLGFLGLLFLVAWLGQIVPAMLRGNVPDAVLLAKTPTSAVYVQDLAVVIPLLFMAAIWLWQQRAWGFILAPTLLVLADVMLVALLSMGVFSAQAGIAGALDMSPVFVVLTLLSLGMTALYFRLFGRTSLAMPELAYSPLGAHATGDTILRR